MFLSPAAAGYQVDVGPLDVSIALFMATALSASFMLLTSACLLSALFSAFRIVSLLTRRSVTCSIIRLHVYIIVDKIRNMFSKCKVTVV